jgi:endo-1,4-beta-xylanase
MPTQHEIRQGEQILQQAAANVGSARKGQAEVRFHTPEGRPLTGLAVEIVQTSQDFLFGNLVFDLIRGDAPYRPELFKQRFLELFNLAIFPFYWTTYERTPGRPEWQRALPTLAWCLSNGITPKGHPLVWPYNAGVPEWLYAMPEGSVDALLEARVLGLTRGFSEEINIWDVTNEAVNHISWDEATQPSFRARYHERALWRGTPVAGAFKREIPIPEAADWVERSLRLAYAGNPRATLIVNDYNQEIDPNVRQRFYDLIRELQARGAPISGIGLQVHPVNHWLWPQQIWETLDMYADLHLPVHITELHQPSLPQPIEGGWREGEWDEQAQADYLEQLYRLFFGHPSVVSINSWGLSDRDSWYEGGGLIDAEYRPKPAHEALKALIKGEWMTEPIRAVTDDRGEVHFTGFFGSYEIAARRPGRQHLVYPVHFAQNQRNEWTFTGEV